MTCTKLIRLGEPCGKPAVARYLEERATVPIYRCASHDPDMLATVWEPGVQPYIGSTALKGDPT